jgi:hypothetical protein
MIGLSCNSAVLSPNHSPLPNNFKEGKIGFITKLNRDTLWAVIIEDLNAERMNMMVFQRRTHVAWGNLLLLCFAHLQLAYGDSRLIRNVCICLPNHVFISADHITRHTTGACQHTTQTVNTICKFACHLQANKGYRCKQAAVMHIRE